MKDIKQMNVTAIQFFDHTHEIQTGEAEYEEVREYSANIIFDECSDEFKLIGMEALHY